jgi:ferredoxin
MTVDAGTPLWQVFDAANSPILFGCRTGICGTCVCRVAHDGSLTPADEDEAETLEVLADGEADVRLACQLDVQGDLALRALE